MKRQYELVDLVVQSEDEELYIWDAFARLDAHFEHMAREQARRESEIKK